MAGYPARRSAFHHEILIIMTTFKQIKVHLDNRTAIVAALQKANGIAVAHTMRTYAAVEQLANDAEARLIDLVGTRVRAVGAQLRYTSGNPVANSYGYSRRATKIVLERRASGWYVTSIKCADVNPGDGGDAQLGLTPAQAVSAVALARKKFTVIKPKGSEPTVMDDDAGAPEGPSLTVAESEVKNTPAIEPEAQEPVAAASEAPGTAESEGNSEGSEASLTPVKEASPAAAVETNQFASEPPVGSLAPSAL